MFAITQRSLRRISILLLLFFCISLTATAQNEPITRNEVVMRTAGQNMVMLPVAGGALLVEGGDEARVTRHIATGGSADAPKFNAGDKIIYLNGERIKSASQLNTLYNSMAVGDEVKMGVQRGEEKMIKTFIKPEAQNRYESADGNQVINMSTARVDAANIENLENKSLWMAGFLVGEKDGRVEIGAALPINGKAEALSDLKSGDQILAINNTKITRAKQVEEVYGAINQGDDVTVEYKSEDRIEKVMFKKPATPNVRMRIDQQSRVSQQ